MSARLRILLVGASGVLGKAIVAELSPRHDIISAGSKTGDIRIDIADPASIDSGREGGGAARRRRLRRRVRQLACRFRRSSPRRWNSPRTASG